jgi:hypothetical protein
MLQLWEQNKGKIVTTAAGALVTTLMTLGWGWAKSVNTSQDEAALERAAQFHKLYQLEQDLERGQSSERLQWQRISDAQVQAASNGKALEVISLFTVGNKVDFDRLAEAVEVMRVLDESGVTAEDVKMLVEQLQALGMTEAPEDPVEAVAPPPPPPYTQQQQIQRDPEPLTDEQLKRYIEDAKTAVKKR